ncbi:unnamed protein product [Lota lota]
MRTVWAALLSPEPNAPPEDKAGPRPSVSTQERKPSPSAKRVISRRSKGPPSGGPRAAPAALGGSNGTRRNTRGLELTTAVAAVTEAFPSGGGAGGPCTRRLVVRHGPGPLHWKLRGPCLFWMLLGPPWTVGQAAAAVKSQNRYETEDTRGSQDKRLGTATEKQLPSWSGVDKQSAMKEKHKDDTTSKSP